jgi:hypothetical protein
MFLKQNKKFLSKDNITFIEKYLFDINFPYYHQPFSVNKETKDLWLSHLVLRRLEETNNLTNVINTTEFIYNQSLDILNNYCKAVNEKPYFFTRIAYNLTFNNNNEKCDIHKDHDYPHKQIIIYLNDCDKYAKTCILNENEELIKEIIPEKYKGICFGDLPHYHFFPKSGIRLVLVATYI